MLARAKGPARTILVSDASTLAGLPPGVYGEWAVEASGKIVVAGTPYLAGSNQGLETGVRNLLAASGWTIEQVIGTVTSNPARLLGRPEPRLNPGQPASFVVFRRPEPSGFVLKDVCVDGALGTRLMRRTVAGAFKLTPARPTDRSSREWVAVRPTLCEVMMQATWRISTAQAVSAGSLPSTQSPSSF